LDSSVRLFMHNSVVNLVTTLSQNFSAASAIGGFTINASASTLAYHFMCKKCNNSSEEVFSKKQANFASMCQTTLANLMCIHNGRIYFSEEKEIIPYLEQNWELLTSQPRRTNNSWHTNIHKTLVHTCFSVQYTVLGGIGKSLRKGGQVCSGSTSVGASGAGGCVTGGNVRSTRRSTAAAVASAGLGANSYGIGCHEDSKAKISEFGIPLDHPVNTENYRYALVEVDPHAKGRKQWDECENTAGKPIPGYFYRVCLYPKVVLSLHDRAQQMKVQDSQTSVTGEKGYSMTRATHSVHTGTWYYEATITDHPEGSATRIGWSQLMGNLQAPCGYDKFSYSWRSRLGTVFHNSRGKHYAESGYTKGDVIGCLIHLPKVASADMIPSTSGVHAPPPGPVKYNKSGARSEFVRTKSLMEAPLINYLPETYKDRPLIKFRNYYYFEEKGDPQALEKQLQPLPQSKIVFYRNGECLGVAFRDIYAGAYYPAISIYKSATVSVNFGPDFKYPPQEPENWLPMSARRESAEIEQAMADMMYLLANDRLIEHLMKECNSQAVVK
uniref:B30.2/SPRY domain-containing protein n=1 Tax=Hydatigena taeniaeformis TaxID=6205 RepID=A0A0R3X4A3_HYDTA